MNRSYLYLFIVLILMHSCASKNQEIVRNETGNVILKCNTKNGVRHGKCYEYYPNGAVKVISSWAAGVRDGESIDYFENGEVYVIMLWKAGKQNGKQVVYFENGNISMTSMWKDGKMDGECFQYYENGGEQIKSYYINDDRMFDEFYDEEGRVVKEHHYITINNELRTIGVVTYDTDNAGNYPENINFQQTWLAWIFANNDTIDYGSFVEYEVDWMCSDDYYVLAYTGNIDHNFNLIDPASMKEVDLENKNRFYPAHTGTDTLRVIFRFRKEGETFATLSLLEKVFTVIEKNE